MNFELLNFIVIAIGVIITVMINWDRLQKTPLWLIGFVVGAFSGFIAGYFL